MVSDGSASLLLTPYASSQARSAGPAFAAQLAGYGQAVAVITSEGERVTYADLAARADAFAEQLPDDANLLAVEARNDVESLVAYLGALRSGRPVILTSAEATHACIYETFQPDARILSAGGRYDIMAGEGRATSRQGMTSWFCCPAHWRSKPCPRSRPSIWR